MQLAQLNVVELRVPVEHPDMATFVAELDPVNALAEAAPGFVWRLKDDESGDATGFRLDGREDVLLNLSVWESVEALHGFTYRSGHADVLRRKREWFDDHTDVHVVLWWVPDGHRPGLDEAAERLEHLRREGPSPYAFTFREPFPPS